MKGSSQHSNLLTAPVRQAGVPIPLPLDLFRPVDRQEIESLRRAWSSGYLGGYSFSWSKFNNIRTGV